MYNKIVGLTDLSEEDAERVYKKAVEILKKEEPSVYLKCMILAGFGGGLGVLGGSIIKDLVFKIQGLNVKAFIILAVCTIAGGIAGGLMVSIRLERKVSARFAKAKEELEL